MQTGKKLSKLMAMGMLLEPHTYRHTQDRQEAFGRLVHWARQPKAPPWVGSMLSGPGGYVERAMWAAAWVHAGFPQVQLGHKLAASLMATKLPDEELESICAPWPAFVVHVPDELVPVFDHGQQRETFVDLLLVEHQIDHISVLGEASSSGFFIGRDQPRLTGEPAGGDEWDLMGEFAPAEREFRTLDLLWRLLIGAELELTEARRVRGPASRSSASARDAREPVMRTYVLTRDVSLDCREAVRGHILGTRRTAPQIQVLVRGHWKRQPCGPESTERRWIPIEPYWRGPEDAPIGVRAHVRKPEEAHAPAVPKKPTIH